MTALAFIDTETTGLHPDHHEIWEVALILRHPQGVSDDEYVWQLPVNLATADPFALDIGRFWDRRVHEAEDENAAEEAITGEWGPNARRYGLQRSVPEADIAAWCEEIMRLTRGAHLVGNVVSFDAERLAAKLRRHGYTPAWHYHIIDVEALAAGLMGFPPPWDSKELSQAIGVDLPNDEDRHTALGDARWARDTYDAVMHRAASTQALAASATRD